MLAEAIPYVEIGKAGLRELSANSDISWSSNPYTVVHDPRFEAGLDTILRWHDSNIYPVEVTHSSEPLETDLGHVQGMENLFLEVLYNAPNISQSIQVGKVALMIRTHDMAEILMGDVPCSDDNPHLRKRKERGEPLAVTMMTKDLQEPAKSTLRHSFSEYEERKTPEAILTKWLDVAQGNRFALEHNLYDTIVTPELKQKHVTNRIVDLIKWTKKLVEAVGDQETRIDIYAITGQEMRKLQEAGYGQYIFDAFDQILTKHRHKT